MDRDRWQKRTSKLLFAVLLLFVIYIVLKYAFGAIFPFLMGLAVAMPLASLSKRSSKRLGGSRKAWAVFYVLLFWGLLSLIIFLGARKLFYEAEEMIVFFSTHVDKISERLGAFFDALVSLPRKLPFLQGLGGENSDIGESAQSFLSEFLSNAAQKVSEIIATMAGRIALSTPKTFAGAAVCVASSFYLCKDFDEIKEYLLKFSAKDSQSEAAIVVSRVYGGIKSYARAYLWIFLMTFVELYVGLLILGRKYAFLCAVSIALLDILPLFGAGLVLVPWGMILIADGALGAGVGMLILFALMTVVRQIAEPRFVGRELGIHPLASLAAMYIGFRFFGIVGMLMAPIGIVVIKEINKIHTKD